MSWGWETGDSFCDMIAKHRQFKVWREVLDTPGQIVRKDPGY